ncbi:siphovirus Gp157 family protein [Myxosarcina sp. GI1(2024)]
MTQTTRLWELSEEIQQLEEAIASYVDDESLSDEARETKLEETFSRWLETGASFKVKAEQVARYIRHQEALATARKEEAKRIRELASQAENQANRLRHYLTNQMLLSRVDRIEGVATKIGLRKKPPQVMLNVPPEELPAEYVKVTHKPDLTKIKAAIKANKDAIDWACLNESHQYSVTIR